MLKNTKCKSTDIYPERHKHDANLLQINIISQLHVLSVDLQDFQSSCSIGNADVHLSVEAACIKRKRITAVL